MKLLTRSQVIRRLRAHAAQLGDLNAAWLQNHDPETYNSMLTHFESMASAREAAGTPKRSQRIWSQERVIAELRRLQRQGRIRITSVALSQAGHHGLLGGIYKVIGSISRARKLAGIPEPGNKPADKRERWDEDRVIGKIRDRHRRRLSLASSKVPHNLKQAAVTYCGGWRAAIEMAGFDYDQARLIRAAWTRDELLAQIRKAVRLRTSKTGRSRTLSSLIAPVGLAIRAMFGSLPDALIAAGFDPALVMQRVPRKRRPERQLLAELRALVRSRPGMLSEELYRTKVGREAVRRFGSLPAATKKIAIPGWPPRRRPTLPSADEVLRLLRERHQRGDGMRLNTTIREDPRLARAAKKHFGTWRAAMQRAGLGKLVGLKPDS